MFFPMGFTHGSIIKPNHKLTDKFVYWQIRLVLNFDFCQSNWNKIMVTAKRDTKKDV